MRIVSRQRSAAFLLGFVLATLCCFETVQAQDDPRNVRRIGHLDEIDEDYSDIWGYDAPDGTALAIVGTLNGTWFVDVTEPDTPEAVSWVRGTLSIWRDIKTAGEYAFVVVDQFSEGAALQVFDLSNPRLPRLALETSEFFNRCHNIFIEGNRLYCVGTGSDDMTILDISNPEAPVELGRFGEFYIHDIFVQNDIAYGGAFFGVYLGILDCSDPANITVLSRTGYPGAATHNTWVTEDGAYCLTTDETESGHINVFDVRDPTNPERIGEWILESDPLASVHNVTIDGSLAYVSWYTNGLQVLDIRNPDFPQNVAAYDTHPTSGVFAFDGAWGVYPYANSGLVYVSDIQTGLYVFEVTPQNGSIEGRVVRGGTDEVQGDIEISIDTAPEVYTTKGDGSYEFISPPGSVTVQATGFGFEDFTATVDVLLDERTEFDIELVPLPSGSLAGTLENEGQPIQGAVVEVLGTPLKTTTDATGGFLLQLIPEGTWEIVVDRFGFYRQVESVEIIAETELALELELVPATYADDFETDQGWTVGAADDDASAGQWVRTDPVGTGVGQFQAEDDRSVEGTQAFVTGNSETRSINDADVDAGTTSLISPAYDLTGLESPVVTYYRWFVSTDISRTPEDGLEVSVSSDGGASWRVLEDVTDSDPNWNLAEFGLRSYIEPTADVRFRFRASDLGPATIVEAGLDDFQIFDVEFGGGPGPLPEGARFRLLALPNPVREEASLSLQLTQSERVKLRIVDVQGRRTRSLFDGELPAGPHQILWDGKDVNGEPAPSGVYFLQLDLSGTQASQRLLKVR